MSDVHDIIESFCVMIILILVGFVVILAISVPWDMMQPQFALANLENVPAAWDTFDDRDFLTQLILVIGYALFILGPLQFILVCIRQQRYDQYVYER